MKMKKINVLIISGGVGLGAYLVYACLTSMMPPFTFGEPPTSKTPRAPFARTESSPTTSSRNDTTPHDTASSKSFSPSSQPYRASTVRHTNQQSAPRDVKTTQLDSPQPTFTTTTGQKYPLRTYKTLSVNDPNGNQWWTTDTGLDTAWDIGPGSYQPTIAVIDTGFALSHEELADKWMINSGEQGTASSENPSKRNCTDRNLTLNMSCNLIDDDYDGVVDNESGAVATENPSQLNCTDQGVALDKSCNLMDDDSNGYADDVTGWDFANNDRNVQAGETNPNGDGTHHATEVSGVLAATGNNSKGIAGVNWNAKILPLQAIDDDSYGNTITVGDAIYYAANRGVDIISLSLGSAGSDSYTREAVQYALSKGSVVVAASGNDGCDCMLYPAAYPEVFAVGAQNPSNQRATFSSYGPNLDILAPGQSMVSSTWLSTNTTSAYQGGIAGTSFATPYVSGLLSLAKSHQPTATWGELTNNLLAAADHTGLSVSNPWSSQIGSGYSRAGNYLSRATTSQTPDVRYHFTTSTHAGTLGSARTYDCSQEGSFPTAPLYELTLDSSTFFTIDPIERVQAQNQGATSTTIGRACVGLPGDAPATTRTLNLAGEIATSPISGKY